MAESKKYWYIQLNVNFFEDDRIDWLCEQQNGYAYVVLYLKLCLKTANNNGILTRQIGDMIIPYNVDKIAEVTHINVDIVRVALELYKKIGLVYEADAECNFMRLPEVPGMVGCVTQAALDKRKQRERKQLSQGQNSENVQDNVREDIQQELRDKSKELRDNRQEAEQDKEGDKGRKRPTPPPKHPHGEYGWVKLSDDEYNRLLSDNSPEEVDRAIAYVDESAQSTGNKNKWKDWNLVVRRCIKQGWGKRGACEKAQGATAKANQAAQQSYQPDNSRIKKQQDWLDAFLDGEGAV